MSHEILIVDDEADIRFHVGGILEDEGYQTREAASGEEALKAVATRVPSLVILDVWLAGSAYDGLQLLEVLKRDHPTLQIVMISGHGAIEMAVNATKKGAYDFIAKPFKTDVLLNTIERALADVTLKRENESLRALAGGAQTELVGNSPAAEEIRRLIEKVAVTESRVLITGPSGAGKSAIAQVIHARSNRAKAPFIALNCAAIDKDALESALFGAEPRGGRPRMTGALEQAHMGSLLLDEVSEIPLSTQGKLVRVLQSGTFQRVGGEAPVSVDIRVLSTSSIDLSEKMTEGLFREDLFYRLNVVPMSAPSLRERREDIPALAGHLMERSAKAKGRSHRRLSQEAQSALQAHHWPGNIWELGNVIERVLLQADDTGEPIRGDLVIKAIGEDGSDALKWEKAQEVMNLPLRDAREAFEREYLLFHLTRFGGNISRTAEFIGMDRAALHRKLKGLGVQNDARVTK